MRTVSDPWLARANLRLPLANGTKITTSGVVLLLYSTLQSGKQSPFNRFALNNCVARNSYYKVKNQC